MVRIGGTGDVETFEMAGDLQCVDVRCHRRDPFGQAGIGA